MHSETGDELRALRQRAYGPNADVADVAAALLRLRELETDDQPVNAALQDGGERPSLPPSDDQQPLLTPDLVPLAKPRRAALRWRTPLLWAASVLVAVLVTALGTAVISNAVIQRVQVDPQGVGATQVTRLSQDPDIEIPIFFTGGKGTEAQAFTRFSGLQVLLLSGDRWGPGGNDDKCILVTQVADFLTATEDSYIGQTFAGCAANAFPATVEIRVTGDMPAELREAYPEGTALQFVFDKAGSDVVVFTSPD